MKLEWIEDRDINNSTYYEASSEINDDGSSFTWMVTQTVVGNCKVWTIEESFDELTDDLGPSEMNWPSHTLAQKFCQQREDALVASLDRQP